MQLVLSSPREFLDAHFESEKLKVMMAAWGMHLDFAPDVAGGALFSYFESMAEQSFGNQAKRPGSSFRADSLQPLCRLFGGRTCVMFARSTEARTRELRRLCPLVTDRTQEGDKPMAKTMPSA